MGKTVEWLAAYPTKIYGVPLCAECAQKRKDAAAAEPEAETKEREVAEHGGDEHPADGDGEELL